MIEIGAFEAKTHFSELLRRVEAGESFCITRRGEEVATIQKSPKAAKARAAKLFKKSEKDEVVVDEAYRKRVRETVGAWLELRKKYPMKATVEEIIAWKNEGRR